MSKAKVTRKWISENYNCISVGYCDLYYLLRYQNPAYYTCGVYGWNFDCYIFGDYAITTGYRGMITNCKADYSISNREYNEKARQIVESLHDFSTEGYQKNREAVNKLLAEYLQKTFNKEITVY